MSFGARKLVLYIAIYRVLYCVLNMECPLSQVPLYSEFLGGDVCSRSSG